MMKNDNRSQDVSFEDFLRNTMINDNLRFSSTYEVIKKLISYFHETKIQQGDHLPTEAKLSEMLDVSRPVLREALKVLEGYGFLTPKKSRGIVYIGSSFIGHFNIFLIDTMIRSENRDDIRKLLLFFSSYSVETFIDNADDYDMFKLRFIVKEKMPEATTFQDLYLHDSAFYELLGKYNNNNYANEFMKSVVFFLHLSRSIAFKGKEDKEAYFESDLRSLMDHHNKLIDALMKRDKREAIKIAREMK